MKRLNEYLFILNPLTWLAWCCFGLLWIMTQFPAPIRIRIGKGLGFLLYHASKKLRAVSQKNIELCFPELTKQAQIQLAKDNYASLGIGLIETAMAWWLPDRRLNDEIEIIGLEHVEHAFAKGKGIILLGPHYFCLEMVGRLLGSKYSFAVMYRPHKKIFIAKIQERFRKKYRIRTIARHRMREVLRTLEENMAIWYAYDVDGGEKRSVFAPFFGIQTASLTAISRMVTLSGASIIPISFYRTNDRFGYKIILGKPVENFPGKSLEEDATRLNALIEEAVRLKPDQYIWQYKRFKTRPAGESKIY